MVIYGIFRESNSLENARDHLHNYLSEQWKILYQKEEEKDSCIAYGFHEWKDIKPLSKTLADELTYTWWIVRRMTAWAAKVPDDHMPPIVKGEINEKVKEIIKKNIYWDGTLIDIIKNI